MSEQQRFLSTDLNRFTSQRLDGYLSMSGKRPKKDMRSKTVQDALISGKAGKGTRSCTALCGKVSSMLVDVQRATLR